MKSPYRFFSHRLYWLAAIAIVVITLSQLLGRYVWQLELFSHYVPHMAVVVLLAALIYPKPNTLFNKAQLRCSQLLRGLFVLIGFFLGIWSLQPFSLFLQNITPDIEMSSKAPPPMLIAYQNVNIGNQHPEKIIQELVGSDLNTAVAPDVIALVEAGGESWQEVLNKLDNTYPIHCGVDESSPFAMQVFAKDAEATCEIIRLLDFPLAKLTLPAPSGLSDQLTAQNTRIIYVAHPPPPISGTMAQARNAYLSELAALIKIKADSKHSVMVVGDFNLSAFSPIYREFMRNSATDTISLQRTTLAGQPTWIPFGIGIDQILVNTTRREVNTQPLTWSGSDHRGFKIEWY